MPISNGTMYPAARQGINIRFTLRLLLLGRTIPFMLPHNLAVLRNYLDDVGRNDVFIELHSTVRTLLTQRSAITLAPIDSNDTAAIEEYGRTNNIDVIYDPDDVFLARQKLKLRNTFSFTSNEQELHTQIESYLAGNGIPWSVQEPIWHIQWLYKYSRIQHGLTNKMFELVTIGQSKQYTPYQAELVRAVVNKAMHVEHAREQLYYYLQLKRRAERANNKDNDFSFELTYHLTNYSFFICSAMDIMARLINDLYSLGFDRFVNYGIEKPEFTDRLLSKRKTLVNIYTRKKFLKWAELMKIRRNSLAHESNLYLTPLIQQRRQPLTDTELEQKVDEAFDWNLFGSMTPNPDLAAMRAIVKQQLDLQYNYEEIVSDIMTLEIRDRTNHETKQYLIFPLRTIDDDFNMLKDVLSRTVCNLAKARGRNTI